MTPEQAKAVKKLLKRGPEHIPGHHPSHAIAAWLGAVNDAAGGVSNGFFGVESCYPEKDWLWYLNTGDTYAPTLCYEEGDGNADCDYLYREKGRVIISCWGNYFE